MNCKVCNTENTKEIFFGHIRAGAFGKITDHKYIVFECLECKCRFLDNFLDPKFYVSDSYRNSYNNSSTTEKFYQLHDENDNEKICKIGLHNFRNKSVADFGAGAGTFLDIVNSVATKTYAIEPASFFHKKLSLKHEVYSYSMEFLKSNSKVDIATSFDVIEHIENPLDFLKDIYHSLNEGGKLYIMTPNYGDILNDLIKDDFDKFNYRTAHYYYFCEESMKNLMELAGFKNYKITFHHKQDLSNLIYWIRDKLPTGKNKYDFFNSTFNDFYKKYLEDNGKASHLWIEGTK